MTLKQEEYWDKRINKLFNEVYQEEELKQIYLDALKYIKIDLDALYNSSKNLTNSELYKLESYTKLLQTITYELKDVRDSVLQQTISQLSDGYKKTVSLVSTLTKKPIVFGTVNNKALKASLKKNWSGEHFSKRIWNNTDVLEKTIKDEITRTILTGDSKDKAVKVLTERMGVGFSSSDRLVRTELMSTINQAQLDTYKDIGVKEYKITAYLDSRTSKICRELNGRIFKIEDGKIGVNVPVFHPFCRSTIVPIINL